MDSLWASREIELAVRPRGRSIPVLVGDAKLNEKYPSLSSNFQCYFLSENPTDEELAQLADTIGRAIVG